jgi:hypothetical protein
MFGTRYMATLLGISFVVHQVGASLGAWGGGIILVHRLKNVITQLEREGANTFLSSRRRPGPIPTIGTGLRRYDAVAA